MNQPKGPTVKANSGMHYRFYQTNHPGVLNFSPAMGALPYVIGMPAFGVKGEI